MLDRLYSSCQRCLLVTVAPKIGLGSTGKLGERAQNWGQLEKIGGIRGNVGASRFSHPRIRGADLGRKLAHWRPPSLPASLPPHCGYHSYLTKLYVSSVLVSAMYGRSSELGLYQTSAYLFDTLVSGLGWVG